MILYYCGRSDCKTCVAELYENTTSQLKVLALEKIRGFPCEKCRKLTENPHRCGECEAKLYCTKECQGSDWWAVHKKMCQDYKKTGRKTFDANARKALVLHQKAGRDFSDLSFLGIPLQSRTQDTGNRVKNIEEVD